MLAKLDSPAIDLGIVVTDLAASTAFYRDLLGFADEGEIAMPGGARMQRLRCGDSVIKLVAPASAPPASDPGGGPAASTGYRYWTVHASNLDEIAEACAAAGHRVPLGPMEIRPGVRILMIEDPDRNWIEFAHYADA